MKRILIIVVIAILMFGFDSCVVQGPPSPTRRFSIPEYRTTNHWGAPRRTSIKRTYWGMHRYGPRPHPYRGRQRY